MKTFYAFVLSGMMLSIAALSLYFETQYQDETRGGLLFTAVVLIGASVLNYSINND